MNKAKRYLSLVTDESLEQHDKKYHPNGYKEGDACKKRDSLKQTDKADEIGSENAGSGAGKGKSGESFDYDAFFNKLADVDGASNIPDSVWENYCKNVKNTEGNPDEAQCRREIEDLAEQYQGHDDEYVRGAGGEWEVYRPSRRG